MNSRGILLLFLSIFFFIVDLTPHVYAYLFIDEFNYHDVKEMEEAGWYISDENYITLTGYSIILKNDCSKTTWPRFTFKNNLTSSHWIAESEGKWINGDYGSLHIIVRTTKGEYSWWGNGYYKVFIFSIDGKEIIRREGFLPSKNEWYVFKLMRDNEKILGFFNNSLIFNVSLPQESVIGIGVNSAWCSETEYTRVSFLSEDLQILSPLNKTYFTTLPYTQIPLNISLHSLNETFYLQIFIDNNLFLNQTFYEEAIINEELNQSIGLHCISIYTNASNVENQTVCYSIIRVLEKPLFITDKDWKNIVSLAPLKQPVLVFDNNEKQINHFIELFKPQQIFLLGNISLNIKNYPTIKISREDLLQFFENKKGVYADSIEKYIYASQIASLLNLSIVFEKENSILDFSQNSTEEIEDFYLKLAKEKGTNINYIILSKPIAYSSIISSLRNGFIVLTNSNNASEIKEILKQKVLKLNSFGFLFNSSQNILRGNYLLLIGLPSFEVEDPVEQQKFLGIIQAEDKEDGNMTLTDIPYADINDDTYLDFAIGRLPEDENLASLIFSRGYLDTSKKALVASEYLYNDYF